MKHFAMRCLEPLCHLRWSMHLGTEHLVLGALPRQRETCPFCGGHGEPTSTRRRHDR